VIGDARVPQAIGQPEYDKKARELKERQTEIALRIEQHQKGEWAAAGSKDTELGVKIHARHHAGRGPIACK